MAQPRLEELLLATEQLNAAVDILKSKPVEDGSDNERPQLVDNIIKAAQRILDVAKSPTDQWVDLVNQISIITSNMLFMKWKVFENIPLDGTSISYVELASKVEVELALLARIARLLVSARVLEQVGSDQVAHTAQSRMFLEDHPGSAVYTMGWENGLQAFVKMPEYFDQYGRKEPQTPNHIPVSYAYGQPGLTFYELIDRDPAWLQRFFKGVGALNTNLPIAGIYDFSWLVSQIQNEEESAKRRPLFIDIGGGGGQAIKAIRAEFPGLPIDRFYLQDRADVIEAGEKVDDPLLKGVQRMAIDFFESQPVKGAIVYWIRRCLHNWGDVAAAKVLKNVAEAMAADSKLLLQEDVLDNPPNLWSASMDFLMLGFGGKQRTRETWDQLAGEAGLEIVGVSRGKGTWENQTVIELVKKSVS
ncbi:O-methyltransferase [Bombardia bombarda]|uniref:O-methyltransferase n=1 Tax=Bombardia bombarda TaxID=252184 RepID=A0AA39XAS4_9PEZI|nr:O-methyltransferase [Bombardia bombarda]